MKDFDKKSLEDDKFTNKEQLEYPLETDIVNIKVLNNNTKLLDEKISQMTGNIGNNLRNIAQESSPKYIENQVKKIDTVLSKVNSMDNGNTSGKFDMYKVVGVREVEIYSTIPVNGSSDYTTTISHTVRDSGYFYQFYGEATLTNDKYGLGANVPVKVRSNGSSSLTLTFFTRAIGGVIATNAKLSVYGFIYFYSHNN